MMQRQCEVHGKTYESVIRSIGGRDMDVGVCPDCALVMVNEFKAQSEREGVERVQVLSLEQEREQRRKRFERVGIPPRFQSRSFDNYLAKDEGQKKALRQVRRYTDRICGGGYGGLILSGNVGNGKTHLACSVGMAMERVGKSVVFMTVLEMVRKIRESYGAGSDTKLQQAIDAFRDLDLLILDEVGLQSGTDDELILLTDVINARYGWMKPTVLISNLNIAGMEQLLGMRVVDRMREDGGVLVEFTWTSFRRQDPKANVVGGES